jgi:hypothetical protein
MYAVLIVGGLAALYFLLEAQIKTATAVKAPVSTGVVVGASPQGNSGVDPTDSEVQTGLTDTAKATSAIPVVGQLAGLAASIAGIFTAGHAAAVAKEASTLNTATPTWLNDIEQTMIALNQGAITPSQAIAYIQQAQSDYYTTVAGIIRKGGPCATQCTIGAQSAAGKPQGWISTSPVCCNTSGTCNASCCIGCYMVEPTTAALVRIINAGGGSWTVPSSQNNGAIAGTPLVKLTYTAPVAVAPVTGLLQTLGL